jgi:hypothetical protein
LLLDELADKDFAMFSDGLEQAGQIINRQFRSEF